MSDYENHPPHPNDNNDDDDDSSLSPHHHHASNTTNNRRLSERKKTPNPKFLETNNADTPSTAATTPSPRASTNKEFYAVRKGYGVECCIFLKWDNCKHLLDGYDKAEFSVFDTIEDAMRYIQTPPTARKATTMTSTLTQQQRSGSGGDLTKKRKRTATLPFSNTTQQKKKKKHLVVSTTVSSTSSGNVMTTTTHEKKSDNNNTDTATDADEDEVYYPPDDSADLPDILAEGYANNRPKGWRATDLFPMDKQDRSLWETRYLQDVAVLKEYRATKPSTVRDIHNMRHLSSIPNAYSLA
jgi:hypothetical protein